MVDINTIELSFKRIPEYNAELAKTVPSNVKTNYLVGSVIAIGIGLFTLLATSQSMLKILGGGLAVGGVGTSVYISQRKTDDSSEAQEERKKFNIAESIRKAKANVSNERVRLTNAAHSFHSFSFDTANAIGDSISFNSYTVKVTDRPDSINIGLRTDKILYRTESYAEFYTTKGGKLKSRQRKRKVADRVKFTVAFPTRKRAVKGVMPFDSYNQMISLYNARHQKAQDLAEFNQRYTIAEENIRKHGDQIYFSPEEKKAIEEAKALASFDLRLNQIGEEVAIVIDESEFAEFDQQLGLDSFSSNPDIETDDEFIDESDDSSDNQTVQFTESELKAIGLPAIRKQFNITARSYNEAFTKLSLQGVTILKK
ncbi:hypothetical protein [Pseudanabaena sp. Chao 1811]|uniref:hypothetical protein n=1 Tax=Pseudanabaena sp. Chao 1811 TaxID=2963092 RepID=UPI0022F388DF|nr:hypothetical protein [Pseudanabaena sp. Chao 1811]